MKLAAVIILYHPNDEVIKNTASYIEQVEYLYVLDNSEKKNLALIDNLKMNKNVVYIENDQNLGIAKALNIAAELAIENGFTYLLTMDQDCSFKNNDFKTFLSHIQNKDISGGIYAPSFFENQSKLFPFSHLVCITSGSIINLEIYEKIGKFKDELFIDEVDVEYCLRLASFGYKLQYIPHIVLEHKLGESTKSKFLFWKFFTSNHSALRRYYIMRNRLYVWKHYKNVFPEYIKFEQKITMKELIKIILVEDKKWEKLKMTFQGYLDYKNEKFGKYNNE